MNKLIIVKKISLGIVLFVSIYFFVQYIDIAKNQFFSLLQIPTSDIKGASTQKAKEVSGKIESDIGNEFEQIKTQALQVSLGDAIASVSRLQKIPQDVQSIQGFVLEQVGSMIQSRK
jgi:hypothetical protein